MKNKNQMNKSPIYKNIINIILIVILTAIVLFLYPIVFDKGGITKNELDLKTLLTISIITLCLIKAISLFNSMFIYKRNLKK